MWSRKRLTPHGQHIAWPVPLLDPSSRLQLGLVTCCASKICDEDVFTQEEIEESQNTGVEFPGFLFLLPYLKAIAVTRYDVDVGVM